jgi:hypothetical protein
MPQCPRVSLFPESYGKRMRRTPDISGSAEKSPYSVDGTYSRDFSKVVDFPMLFSRGGPHKPQSICPP